MGVGKALLFYSDGCYPSVAKKEERTLSSALPCPLKIAPLAANYLPFSVDFPRTRSKASCSAFCQEDAGSREPRGTKTKEDDFLPTPLASRTALPIFFTSFLTAHPLSFFLATFSPTLPAATIPASYFTSSAPRRRTVTMGNKGATGPFAPLVVAIRNVYGTKNFNQLRGKAISLHSQGAFLGRENGLTRVKRGRWGIEMRVGRGMARRGRCEQIKRAEKSSRSPPLFLSTSFLFLSPSKTSTSTNIKQQSSRSLASRSASTRSRCRG